MTGVKNRRKTIRTRDDFPKFGADLVAALTGLQMNNFSHFFFLSCRATKLKFISFLRRAYCNTGLLQRSLLNGLCLLCRFALHCGTLGITVLPELERKIAKSHLQK